MTQRCDGNVEPEGSAYRSPAAGSRTQTLDVGDKGNKR